MAGGDLLNGLDARQDSAEQPEPASRIRHDLSVMSMAGMEHMVHLVRLRNSGTEHKERRVWTLCRRWGWYFLNFLAFGRV